MKLKKFWIPTLLLGIIGAAAKLGDTFFSRGNSKFILGHDACNGIFIASIILMLLTGWVMLIAVRKAKVTAQPTKNIPAGFLGFIASVAVLGGGVISMLSIGAETNRTENLISCICGICGGIVMLYCACISITGHNGLKKAPVLALALPIWACGRLIVLFINYSKVSIHSTEMYDVISTAFLCLFLFYHAMFFAEIDSTKSYKRSIIYGMCFVMCGLITTTDIIIKMFFPAAAANSNIDTLVIEPTLSRFLLCTADASFCLYAIFFIAGMIKNAVVNDPSEDDEYDEDEDETSDAGVIAVKIEDDEKPEKAKGNKKSEKAAESKAADKRSYRGLISTADNADSEPAVIPQDEMKEPEPFSGTALRFDDTVPEERDEAGIKLSEPEEEKAEPVVNGLTFENVSISQPEPEKADAEPEKPVEAVTYTQPEPVAEEIPEPVAEPVLEKAAAEPEEVSEPEEELYGYDDDYTDNVFADENGEVNYEDIFKLLDSMSEETADED